MRHLSRFLSIFEVAHPEFGESGRQKWGIHPVFCSDFEAAHLKFEGGGRTFFQPLRATRSDYGQNAVFWRLARKCQSPITRQNVDSWNLSVNGSDFDKCSAALQLLNHCTWPRLRAKRCFLKFTRNLRPHCFGEGNRVEHFLNFGWFCSTLRAARAEFVGSGRQNEAFPPVFVYFRDRTSRICRQR